jgi:hypothetical protein
MIDCIEQIAGLNQDAAIAEGSSSYEMSESSVWKVCCEMLRRSWLLRIKCLPFNPYSSP